MQCTWQAAQHKCTTQSTACTLRQITKPNFHSQQQKLARYWHKLGMWMYFSALFIFVWKSYCRCFSVPYLIGVSSLVCELDGGQQQCVNPGHPRVRLSHSTIHCYLVFLPASFLPSPPSALFLKRNSDFPNQCSSAWFFSFFFLFSASTRKTKTGWKTATTCCSQSYLQCRSPL